MLDAVQDISAESGEILELDRRLRHAAISSLACSRPSACSTLLAVAGGVALIASGPFSARPLPRSMVLSLDLRNVPPEAASSDLLHGGLFRSSRDLVDVVQLLWQAADDPRVVGLFVEIGDDQAGLARVQELRQAIANFRGKGKFAVGFAESLGGSGSHLGDYYLASALDQIWLQPSGGFAVTGIAVETPFLKDGLDKLGVRVEGGKRYEYKSAPDSFLETGYTGPARENLQQLLDSLFGQFVADVARDRTPRAGAGPTSHRRGAVRCGTGARGRPGRPDRLSRRRAGGRLAARRHRSRPGIARRLCRRRHAAEAAAATSSPWCG